MIFYRSINTNRIVSKSELRVLDSIYGVGQAEILIELGALVLIEEPTVLDLIGHSGFNTIMLLYCEQHPDVSYQTALAKISKMIEEHFGTRQ